MDCNNYSFTNTNGNNTVLAYCKKGFSGYPVSFEIVENWFGDRFYFVSDLFGSCGEYPLSRFEAAARFYNSLVPDADAVPLF